MMGLYHAIAVDDVTTVLDILAVGEEQNGWDGISVIDDTDSHRLVSPLIEAVRLQSPGVLRALLSLPEVVRHMNTVSEIVEWGVMYSALHVACRMQDVGSVEAILLAQQQAGQTLADMEVATNEKTGITPLWLTLKYQERHPNNNNNNNNNNDNNGTATTVSIISLLLSHGANPHIMRYGTSLLHRAAASPCPTTAVELCQLLIRYGADVHRHNSMGETVLQVAARQNNPALIAALLRAGASVDPRNPEVRISISTYLHDWSQQSLYSLQAFLENGIDPNSFCSDGYALLHWTIAHCHVGAAQQPSPVVTAREQHDTPRIQRVLRLLITRGANVDLPERYEPHETPLIMACRTGSLIWVEALLDAGASVHRRDSSGRNGMMALVKAWELPPGNDCGSRRIFHALLRAGVGPRACRDDRGRTLWHTASMDAGDTTWLPLLLSCMEPLVTGATLTDYRGQTPLHVAASHHNADAVRWWLSHAPSLVHVRDERGRVPLHGACEKNRPKLVTTAQRIAPWKIRAGDGGGAVGVDLSSQSTVVGMLLRAGSDPLSLDADDNMPWFSANPLDVTLTMVRAAAHAGIFCQRSHASPVADPTTAR